MKVNNMEIQAIGDHIIFKIIDTIQEKNTPIIKGEVVSVGSNLTEIREKDIIYIIHEGYDYLPNDLCVTSFFYIIGKEK